MVLRLRTTVSVWVATIAEPIPFGELLGFVVPESLGPAVPLSMDVPASMMGAEASMIGAEASIVMPESLGADASFWTTVPESVDPASIRAG